MRVLLWLRYFFIWLAGADRHRVTTGPDTARYTGYGVAVLLGGVMAFVSLAVALNYVFDAGPAVFVPVGVVWCVTIWNFDRLVTSHVSDKTGMSRVVAFLPRIAIALVLGVTISEPLVIRVYEPEIRAEIAAQQQESVSAAADQVRRDSPLAMERASLEARRARNERDLTAANRRADAALAAFDAEEDGRGGTRVPGYGPVARAKEAELQRAQAARAEVKARVDADNARIAVALREVERRISDDIRRRQQVIHDGDGFLAREQALGDLVERHPDLAIRRWLLMLVLVLADLMALLAKALWPPSDHDRQISSERRVRAVTLRAKEEAALEAAAQDAARATARAKVIADAAEELYRANLIHLMEATTRLQEVAIRVWERKVKAELEAGNLAIDPTPPAFVLHTPDRATRPAPVPSRTARPAPRTPPARVPHAAPHPADVGPAPGTRRPIRPLIKVIIRRLTFNASLGRVSLIRVVLAGALAITAQASAEPAPKVLAFATVSPASSSILSVDGIATVHVPQGGVSGTGRLVVAQTDGFGPTGFVRPFTIDLAGTRMTRPFRLEMPVPDAEMGQPPRLLARNQRNGALSVVPARWDEQRRVLVTHVSALDLDFVVQR